MSLQGDQNSLPGSRKALVESGGCVCVCVCSLTHTCTHVCFAGATVGLRGGDFMFTVKVIDGWQLMVDLLTEVSGFKQHRSYSTLILLMDLLTPSSDI